LVLELEAMSAEPIDSPAHLAEIAGQIRCVVRSTGPHVDVSTSTLADTLEAQHDRGESLCPETVFELVDRLVVAEGLAVPLAER
jgi:hypothetical protein